MTIPELANSVTLPVQISTDQQDVGNASLSWRWPRGRGRSNLRWPELGARRSPVHDAFDVPVVSEGLRIWSTCTMQKKASHARVTGGDFRRASGPGPIGTVVLGHEEVRVWHADLLLHCCLAPVSGQRALLVFWEGDTSPLSRPRCRWLCPVRKLVFEANTRCCCTRVRGNPSASVSMRFRSARIARSSSAICSVRTAKA